MIWITAWLMVGLTSVRQSKQPFVNMSTCRSLIRGKVRSITHRKTVHICTIGDRGRKQPKRWGPLAALGQFRMQWLVAVIERFSKTFRTENIRTSEHCTKKGWRHLCCNHRMLQRWTRGNLETQGTNGICNKSDTANSNPPHLYGLHHH